MTGRSTKACILCGRLIYADHNFFHKNYEAHVAACPRQQRKRMERAVKRAGQGVVPIPGQLPLPGIEGMKEVIE